MIEVVFDIETKKAFDEVGGYFPEKLGVSVVGLYRRDDKTEKEEYLSFREEELPQLWKIFESADRVVGFNSLEFDLPALQPYYRGDLKQLPSLDIMVEIERVVGHRVKLDAIAKETLGEQKSGSGLDALQYYHDGDWDSLIKYCLQDVKVTKEIYDYGVKNKYLRFKNKWNRLVEVPVDFAIKEMAKKVQTTLF